MDRRIYENCLNVLKKELVLALGCTEPIAVAYAAAYAKHILGKDPQRVKIACSGNMIKNVKGVTVPNSGGMKGIEAAVAMGLTAGDHRKGLELLNSVTREEIDSAKAFLSEKRIDCELARGVDNLYICVRVECGEESAEVTVAGGHTRVVGIRKNGVRIWGKEEQGRPADTDAVGDPSRLTLENILQFADEVSPDDVKDILERQILYNMSIAEEGLQTGYGVNVGRVILNCFGDDIRNRAIAYAAAGSDARMSGCSLPVVINSGSGNQGMTVSLPIIQYSLWKKTDRERLYRALTVGNLVAIYQKSFIGRLSAYCGAVCAAAGAVSGIAWLEGQEQKVIEATITNTICTVGGMVCDGAKPSCASKIAVALDAAMLAYEMAKKGYVFQQGEGIVMDNAGDTIRSVGRMARRGMAGTDTEILRIMLGKGEEN